MARLIDILNALPERELASLGTRVGFRFDPAKRLDPPAQLARALVGHADLRDPSRLPGPSVELLHRVAEARGSLMVSAVPPSMQPLSERGLMFARGGGHGQIELVLPAAYLVQMRSWEGEDPRCLRALLTQASVETLGAIASYYLGRTATMPLALSLETAWESLGDATKLEAELAKLSPAEQRLLERVYELGGEVDTSELLELEREPLRLRTASGATPSRRGVGFSLERRGLLLPVHPNRYLLPTEVGRILGRADDEARAQRRAEVRSRVIDEDHAPRRARFSEDPAPLALGLALAARELGAEVRAGIGTPKSLIARLATRFGRFPEPVALIVALSRTLGLWDASALSESGPPGSVRMHELTRLLYDVWRKGGTWDEAREEPEILRLPVEQRDASASGVVRELVLEALRELGESRWLPWSSLAGYLATDHRLAGVERLLRRWAERVGVEPPSPIEIARKMALESLPALGVVDLGDDGNPEELVLRLTARGRALLAEGEPALAPEPSRFEGTHVLRVGTDAKVSAVLALYGLVEVGRASEALELVVTPQTLSRALSAGYEAAALRARIEALATMPETLAQFLTQASVVIGRASFVRAAGFLWVDDPNLRELLRTRRATSELFVDPSPQGGLLVLEQVELERLVRRCRSVGVEVVVEGQSLRARRGGDSVRPDRRPNR